MLLAVTIFDPDTLLGAFSPIIFLLAIAVAAWAYARVHIAKAQDQAIATWRSNFEAQEKRAILAEEDAKEQRALKHELRVELAAERMKTDQTIVLAEIASFHKSFAEREKLFHRLLEAQETSRGEVELQLKQTEERVVAIIARQSELIEKQSETLERVVNAVVSRQGEQGEQGEQGPAGPRGRAG